MKRSDSAIVIPISITLILVLWKIFVLHGDAITAYDGDVYSGIDKAAFSLYSSDTAQVQLLASHALWYNGVADSRNNRSVGRNRAVPLDNQHMDVMWLNLVKKDFTLKGFATKCSSGVSSTLTEKIEILFVGHVDWTDKNNKFFDQSYLNATTISCPTLASTENHWSDSVHCVNMYNESRAFKTLLNANSFRDAENLKTVCHASNYSINIVDHNNKLDDGGYDIVIVGDCGSVSDISFLDVNIENVYIFYDQLIAKVYHYRKLYPKSVIVWSKPKFHDDMDAEVKVLHNYLIMKHLIHDNGVLVVQPEYRFSYTKNGNDKTSLKIIKILEQQVRCLLSFHESGTNGLKILANLQGDFEDNWKHKVSTLAEDLSQDFHYRDRPFHNTLTDQWLHPLCSAVINSMKYDSKCLPYPKELFSVLVTGLGGSGSHFVANELRNRGLKIGHENIDADGSVSWIYAVNDIYVKRKFPHHAKYLNSKMLKSSGHVKRSIFSPRFQKVIQVVRCPLSHISSFTSHLADSYAFVQALVDSEEASHGVSTKRSASQSNRDLLIDAHNRSLISDYNFQKHRYSFSTKCKRGDSCNLGFSTFSWLVWNNHIDKYADITFKIENSTALIDYICTYLSHKFSHAKCSPATADSRNRYKASVHHNVHNEYRLTDIAATTPSLIEGILTQARLYGYIKNKHGSYNNKLNMDLSCTN